MDSSNTRYKYSAKNHARNNCNHVDGLAQDSFHSLARSVACGVWSKRADGLVDGDIASVWRFRVQSPPQFVSTGYERIIGHFVIHMCMMCMKLMLWDRSECIYLRPTKAYMLRWIRSLQVWIMVCFLVKPRSLLSVMHLYMIIWKFLIFFLRRWRPSCRHVALSQNQGPPPEAKATRSMRHVMCRGVFIYH